MLYNPLNKLIRSYPRGNRSYLAATGFPRSGSAIFLQHHWLTVAHLIVGGEVLVIEVMDVLFIRVIVNIRGAV